MSAIIQSVVSIFLMIYLTQKTSADEVFQPVMDPEIDLPKRIVCNAYTGCSSIHKKSLSQSNQGAAEDLIPDESLSSVLDLSAEPAVEDLNRQIMSEAKMWEAIQEANQEILRQKQENRDRHVKKIRYGR